MASLEDLSSGYLIPELLFKIDPTYFHKAKDLKNWYDFKKLIEQFLEKNGIDEEIDIDVIGIHKKQIASIIAAVFQIFSIISVFAEKEWKNSIHIL